MRIVQTFWTAGRNPLEYSFGWLHPEYNLMSWALSCLSLREHYDEVALYTDTRGKEVLIDLLHLPYTEVHVVFDDFSCLPQHWALSKIKTYSLQDKPFLHVDGDVYLPKPIAPAILEAPLVAQNIEIGTGFYRSMMDKILAYKEIDLPIYVRQGLKEETIASYNMGIFGGTDINFIQSYCQEAFRFMDDNHMNDASYKHSEVWCNILFEQVFFALLSDIHNIKVACIGRPMKDEGYKGNEFCNFYRYEEMKFLHLLGGHKRCKQNYEMLAATLIRLYPRYLTNILSLFPKRNIRMYREEKLCRIKLTVQMSLAQYEDFIEEKEAEWYCIPNENILSVETSIAGFVTFERTNKEEKDNLVLHLNPKLEVFHIPTIWHRKATRLLKQQLGCEENYPLEQIAVVPTIMGNGVRQVPIVGFQVKIIEILRSNGNVLKWRDLESLLIENLAHNEKSPREGVLIIIKNEIRYLLRNGLLILKQ